MSSLNRVWVFPAVVHLVSCEGGLNAVTAFYLSCPPRNCVLMGGGGVGGIMKTVLGVVGLGVQSGRGIR
jgi:hypothetical protein